MKKIIVLFMLFWGWNQVIAQEKIETEFDLYKVKLSFNDKSQRMARGFFYSINDSVIILSDTRKKSDYQTGNYTTTEYPLDQIRKIKANKLHGELGGLLIGSSVAGAIGYTEQWRIANDNFLISRETSSLIVGAGVGVVGAVFGSIVGKDVVSAKINKTNHLAERFNHCAVVRNPEIVGHERFKFFSMDPVLYRRNIQFEMGYKYRIAFEQPIYKGNSLLLGVGYKSINTIHVSGEKIVNRYFLKTNQALIDVENLDMIKDFSYGRVTDGLFDFLGKESQSIYLSYHDFLPEYSVPITLDARSYFGLKPDNLIKPFCEIGVGLNAVKGYDFSVSNAVHYSYDSAYEID